MRVHAGVLLVPGPRIHVLLDLVRVAGLRLVPGPLTRVLLEHVFVDRLLLVLELVIPALVAYVYVARLLLVLELPIHVFLVHVIVEPLRQERVWPPQQLVLQVHVVNKSLHDFCFIYLTNREKCSMSIILMKC